MKKVKKVLFIFGTRPEAIKMAPLIKIFLNKESNFITKVCLTAQHREMVDKVIDFFKIPIDFDLNLMRYGQDLFNITSKAVIGIKHILEEYLPELIFVQGDTTSAFIGALSGYYKKIKVAHIEAGLRSFKKFSPFPEEVNRIMISHIADYHFAPTEKAKDNLSKENIKSNVWVVGNTVIDALKLGLNIIKKQDEEKYLKFFHNINLKKKNNFSNRP